MRRLLAILLVAFLGIPLLAAEPPPFYSKPNVIVYPFISNGSSVDREASSRLATIIATAMANTGLVTVTPPPPGTDRKDYLSVARHNQSEYYVSGFISPLGNGVSIVEQVVSTATGIVVYSQSTQLNTYQDASGQGDDLAGFISRHANRGFAAIGTPPPASSPTPAASNGPEANLGKLFGRRKKAAATPKPSASPTARPLVNATAPAAALVNVPAPPSAPPRAATTPAPRATATPAAVAATETYAVVPVGGSASEALRELAATQLAERSHAERAATAAAACTGHAPHAVLTGLLTVTPEPTTGGGNAKFDLTARDCAGKTLWHQTHGGDATGPQGLETATERAVDAAIGAYLNPPKKRKR